MSDEIRTLETTLGRTMEDRFTGLTGITTSVAFNIDGSVQLQITPAVNECGTVQPPQWFGLARLKPAFAGKVMVRNPVKLSKSFETLRGFLRATS